MSVLPARARRRAVRGSLPLQVPSTPLPPEALPAFWHPQRFGVRLAPDRFRRQLHAIHPDLEATWMPLDERWLIWARQPTVRHHLCRGWSLKFVWQRPSDQAYLPLDNRLLASIYARDYRQYGSARAYYDRLEAEILRERERREADTNDETRQRARDYLQSRKIKNIGHGSKFALHHDGSIVPSKGEIAWRMSRREKRTGT